MKSVAEIDFSHATTLVQSNSSTALIHHRQLSLATFPTTKFPPGVSQSRSIEAFISQMPLTIESPKVRSALNVLQLARLKIRVRVSLSLGSKIRTNSSRMGSYT